MTEQELTTLVRNHQSAAKEMQRYVDEYERTHNPLLRGKS